MSDYAGLTDAALLDRFRRRQDSQALAAIVRRHHAVVCAACRQVLGATDEADDAYQTTFLLLLRRAERIHRPQALSSWLYGVAYRVALRIRQRRAKQRSLTSEPLVDQTPSAFELLSDDDQRLATHEAIASLPTTLREPLVLRYLSGKTNREVADHLALTEMAVEGRLKRAKTRLRAKLVRRGLMLSSMLAVVEQAASVDAQDIALADRLVQVTVDACQGNTSSGMRDSEQALETLIKEEVTHMVRTQLSRYAVAASICSVAVGIILGPQLLQTGHAQSEDPFAIGDEQRIEATLPTDQAAEQIETRLSLTTATARDALSSPTTQSQPIRFTTMDPATQQIIDKLQEPTEIEAFDESLSEVVTRLEELHDIEIKIDQIHLDQVGVTSDQSVNIQLKRKTLASALRLMLRDLGLTYTVTDETLLVTTPDFANDDVTTRVYTLPAKWPITGDALEDLITKQIQPASWSDTGRKGAIDAIGLTLVVTQSFEVHQQIDRLLTQLDQSFRSSPEAAEAAAKATPRIRSKPVPAQTPPPLNAR
ncbi:MAG: sigma-70 family RNA polymerase sigma factor [Planctomycetales bacterium]|nr:sigma-70 family RNA polymerase sigma factor [Planctomycetales bacterium]